MSVFHAGEQAVQKRAGVEQMASRIGSSIHDTIPPAARQFLQRQPFVVVSSRDQSKRVWASLLCGPPGFCQVLDERTLSIDAVPVGGDPLGAVLDAVSGQTIPVGVLAIEPATRRRMRLNGQAQVQPGGGIYVRADQVYSNCAKYIQKREPVETIAAAPGPAVTRRPSRTQSLSRDQQQWVEQADTFFIATTHPQAGADASHRGGNPGFVRVANARTLCWPDYEGNALFNTLGNLAVDPSAGLLFLDFERGNTLQLTGKAEVLWDAEAAALFAGAARVVRFDLEEVLETAGTSPLRFRFVEYSPFNPA